MREPVTITSPTVVPASAVAGAGVPVVTPVPPGALCACAAPAIASTAAPPRMVEANSRFRVQLVVVMSVFPSKA